MRVTFILLSIFIPSMQLCYGQISNISNPNLQPGTSAPTHPTSLSEDFTTKAPTSSSSSKIGSEAKGAPIKQPEIFLPKVTPKVLPSTLNASLLHPGILVLVNGQLQGGDDLLNLGNQIPVYVEIIRPQDDHLDLTEEQLFKRISSIFNEGGIAPHPSPEGPLPAFQIKVFLYPIDRGYAAFCEGRLFESVNLKRFELNQEMLFQAITWQRETLLVAPTNKIVSYIENQVGDIAQAFTESFKAFEQRKTALSK